jgi:hypothetical protein
MTEASINYQKRMLKYHGVSIDKLQKIIGGKISQRTLYRYFSNDTGISNYTRTLIEITVASVIKKYDQFDSTLNIKK